MRLRQLAHCFWLLLACGASDPDDDQADDDGAAEPDGCALIAMVMREAVATLKANAPACTSDADCVYLDTGLSCRGGEVDLCGEIVHREAAERWDPEALCSVAEQRIPKSDSQCSIQASCADLGNPACRAARCVGDNE